MLLLSWGLAFLAAAGTVSGQEQMMPKNMGGMYEGTTMETVNMTSNGFCYGSGTSMLNGFQLAHGDNLCAIFLFPDAVVDSRVKYAFAALGAFLLGFLSELLVILQNVLSVKMAGRSRWGGRVLAQTLLYGLQMVTAYFCMLLAMTYEATLFSLVIVGFLVGHFAYLHHKHAQKKISPVTGNLSERRESAASPVWISLWHRVVWLCPRACWLVLLVVVLVWDEQVEGAFGREAGNLFSWHALCMTLAGPVFMSEAILLFTSPVIPPAWLAQCAGTARQTAVQCAHVALHTLTLLLSILGMVAIAYYKSESGQSDTFPFFTLYSPHSWLGVAVMVLWVLQFVAKMASHTVLATASETSKFVWKRLHVFFGHAIYIGMLTTCALGLQDMQSSDLAGAGYAQDSMFAQLACAGVVMLMFLGVAVYLVPELKQMVASATSAS